MFALLLVAKHKLLKRSGRSPKILEMAFTALSIAPKTWRGSTIATEPRPDGAPPTEILTASSSMMNLKAMLLEAQEPLMKLDHKNCLKNS